MLREDFKKKIKKKLTFVKVFLTPPSFIFYFDEMRQKLDILRVIFVIFPQKIATIGTILGNIL